jgi:hypothetical protein
MSDVYDNLLAELNAGELTIIERRVFDALKSFPVGLRRQQLVAIVFNELTPAGGMNNNNTKDRKVRKAIESLRGRLVPIVSSSGEAGYRLDISEDGRRAMVRELISRRNKLNDLIARAAKFYSLPAEYIAPQAVEQQRLI